MAEIAHQHVWGNAPAYEVYIGRWSRLVAEQFVAWLALSSGLRWLDVRCGTGALTQAILTAAAPRDLLGIDLSSEFTAAAKT